MIYVMGIFGFLAGFAFGLMVLHFLLRHKPREVLMNDKALKYKAALVTWGMAAFGAYGFAQMYKLYFPSFPLS